MSVSLITPTINRVNLNKIQPRCQNNIKAQQANSCAGKFPFSACYISFKGLRDKQPDINRFRSEFNKLGVSPDITDNIQPEEMNKWDIRNIYTLQWIEKGANLIELLSNTLQGTYKDFLFDHKTDIGRTNLETKKSFESEGLNYDKWLNYDGKKEFKYNGKEYEIGLWKREPEKDLFIGNHVNSCISTPGDNNDVIYGALVNTNVQYILIKEKASKKLKGYARVYFMKEEQNKEKNILLDKYEASFNDYRLYPKSEPHLLNFIEDYSKAVTNNNSSKILLNTSPYKKWKGCPIIKDKFKTIGNAVPDTRTSTKFKTEPDYTREEKHFYYTRITQ